MATQHTKNEPAKAQHAKDHAPAAADAVEQGHQGRVKDPEHDGRLKENREHGVSKHTADKLVDSEPNAQGRVKDPEHDGRLKQNRG